MFWTLYGIDDIQLFGKATFVMDRGYDDNKMFLKLDELEQNYVIRLTSKRKLIAINALNFYITLCMAFLAQMSMKSESHAPKVAIIQTAAPIKEKVNFCYYRLAKGIAGILSYAKEGVRLWFRTKRPTYRQLCLKLVA